MVYYLDAAVIVIMAVTCAIGYYRGFFRYIICMLGTITAALIAFGVSAALAVPVYERYLEEPATTMVSSALEDIDIDNIIKSQLEQQGLDGYLNDDDIDRALDAGGDIGSNLSDILKQNGAADELADNVNKNLSAYFDNELVSDVKKQYNESGLGELISIENIDTQEFNKAVQILCSGNTEQAAEYITDTAIKPMLVNLSRIVIFIISFIIIELVLKLILVISGVFTKLPPINAANRFGGLVLGAAKGLLYISIIAFGLSIAVNATNNSLEILNADICDRTYLFKYFFDFFYK